MGEGLMLDASMWRAGMVIVTRAAWNPNIGEYPWLLRERRDGGWLITDEGDPSYNGHYPDDVLEGMWRPATYADLGRDPADEPEGARCVDEGGVTWTIRKDGSCRYEDRHKFPNTCGKHLCFDDGQGSAFADGFGLGGQFQWGADFYPLTPPDRVPATAADAMDAPILSAGRDGVTPERLDPARCEGCRMLSDLCECPDTPLPLAEHPCEREGAAWGDECHVLWLDGGDRTIDPCPPCAARIEAAEATAGRCEHGWRIDSIDDGCPWCKGRL